ncbi:valine--tRNA ligase [Candidatus Haliotispira prima]|uniref:Valine--tRNA ligase n=1 Tax=Candidatus Haliotispira prima TaxID=3034016 RepID=A0ABY8MFT0_9SPIO|nr:valine--tRNA ligase [Candidatus Haliotispira prima]
MSTELAKNYNPADFEQRIYRQWLEQGAFTPDSEQEGSYSIVIPPPNVTGVLHMGHGLNGVLQDILIRYERMQGKDTLWLPGTDHAGIATQHVVEKRLHKEGKTRRDLGREAFLRKTWEVKEEHHATISEQFRSLGASVDWSRERFTMDEGLSRAVREVFVSLYEEGLIYRGKYLVNWCPSCTTALADDEVEHEEENGGLYELFYPFVEKDLSLTLSTKQLDGGEETRTLGGIVVATTRPETLFGDQAVAVHPDDPRYIDLIGKQVRLPLSGRTIPIIADKFCDMAFGSGAVKITPAHDPNDYQVAERHGLVLLNILHPDGTLNAEVPEPFCRQSCREARKMVLAALKEEGLLLKSQNHRHQVGHCYRCSGVIEPYLSEQWFVKMQPLAKPALAALEREEIRFYPARWSNTYRHWMNNIRDWCISRQLWWGHRIPAWHCASCGQISVSREDLGCCPDCGSSDIRQDEDVLDTWFSSWLWPFSTLGWPEDTADMRRFYPTNTLVTAYDIIFFWVARMVMAGLHFTGRVPFRDIYITPLVRDKQGRKMSKSLGNGIDPLDVIARYGADAMKFTISYLSAQGRDLPLDMDSFKLGSRFCNKIWNAVRFLLLNVDTDALPSPGEVEGLSYEVADLWIWERFDVTVRAVEQGRAAYRFDDMSRACYEFFWNDFCDWYVEVAKLRLGRSGSEASAEKSAAGAKLIEILEAGLRLLHPFVSFLTEELYACLPAAYRNKSLIDAPYPRPYDTDTGETEARYAATKEQLQHFARLQELVTSVRTLRSEFCLPPSEKIAIAYEPGVCDSGFASFFAGQSEWVETLCTAQVLVETGDRPRAGAIGNALQEGEVLLFVRDFIDVEKEKGRLAKLIAQEEKLVRSVEGKLGNARFLERAPAELVAQEKQKLDDYRISLKRNQAFLKQL